MQKSKLSSIDHQNSANASKLSFPNVLQLVQIDHFPQGNGSRQLPTALGPEGSVRCHRGWWSRSMDPWKGAVLAPRIALEVGSAAFRLKGRRLAPHDGPVAGADVGLRWRGFDLETGFIILLWGRCWLGHDPVPGWKRAPEGSKERHLASHQNAIEHQYGQNSKSGRQWDGGHWCRVVKPSRKRVLEPKRKINYTLGIFTSKDWRYKNLLNSTL